MAASFWVDVALFWLGVLALRRQSGALCAKQSQNRLQNPQNLSCVRSLSKNAGLAGAMLCFALKIKVP
jgi:hypothetical protein